MTAGEQAGAIAPGILWVAVEEALLERELVGHAVAAGDAVHRARDFEGDRARDRADYAEYGTLDPNDQECVNEAARAVLARGWDGYRPTAVPRTTL